MFTSWLAHIDIGLAKVVSRVVGTTFLLCRTVVTSVVLIGSLATSRVVPVILEVQHIALVVLPRAIRVQLVFRRPSRWVVVWTVVLLARVAMLSLV